MAHIKVLNEERNSLELKAMMNEVQIMAMDMGTVDV